MNQKNVQEMKKFSNVNSEQSVNIEIDQLENVKCDCGCETFIPAVKVKKISAIISPSGREEKAAVQTLVCIKCKKEVSN